jgi:ABC-type transporter Mla subunit MlaD
LEDIFQALEVSPQALGVSPQSLGDLSQTLGDITQTLGDITQALRDITQTLGDITQTLRDTTQTLGDITQTLRDITQTLRDITQTLPDPYISPRTAFLAAIIDIFSDSPQLRKSRLSQLQLRRFDLRETGGSSSRFHSERVIASIDRSRTFSCQAITI